VKNFQPNCIAIYGILGSATKPGELLNPAKDVQKLNEQINTPKLQQGFAT